MSTADKAAISELVAKYGSSSATAWLEFERYKLWSPSEPVPESSFKPVQGYMERGPYIFAWGNPLVSDPSALPNVAKQFIAWCDAQDKRPVWSNVDGNLEEVLGSPEFGWSTCSCIYEDVVDPAHVIELTSPDSKGQEGQKVVKDLKKNLYRAEKYNVKVQEVKGNEWTEEDKVAIEQGIRDWKASKSGVQIASTTGLPWLDSEHRRYWVAKQEAEQIKNAVSFPSAPKGTSEALIYTALKDLHEEQEEADRTGTKIPHPSNNNFHAQKITPASDVLERPSMDSARKESVSDLNLGGMDTPTSETPTSSTQSVNSTTSMSADSSQTTLPNTPTNNGQTTNGQANGAANGRPSSPPRTLLRDNNRVKVTFGISAAPKFEPIHNLGGWKVSALSKTYGKVAKGAKLVSRGEFRNKFDSEHDPMYVCYPPDGFGLDGVNSLLRALRK
ncbi:hypothetical protein CPB83DRAFT_889479 [Crepidotus variabilis]|uniref:Uncharacterized protein n=1 Tax=Crepidotus variabilis TaxID=179855 RepID=A0A9P6JVG7_9AGAR|nr:hypothetical protein CPB83DRAFT_889479 [Crepidotus variabilis]